MNSKSPELFIDHEVRIRMLESIFSDVRNEMKEMRIEFRSELKSQFHWSVGMNFTIVLAILVPIILHLAKLI